MVKVKFAEIERDTDGERVDGLPSEVTPDVDPGVDVNLDGANVLSDKFGWCVRSFQFSQVA